MLSPTQRKQFDFKWSLNPGQLDLTQLYTVVNRTMLTTRRHVLVPVLTVKHTATNKVH